jgi:hypothetical protein
VSGLLVWAAHMQPGLAELLPPPDANGVTCPVCEGQRWFAKPEGKWLGGCGVPGVPGSGLGGQGPPPVGVRTRLRGQLVDSPDREARFPLAPVRLLVQRRTRRLRVLLLPPRAISSVVWNIGTRS